MAARSPGERKLWPGRAPLLRVYGAQLEVVRLGIEKARQIEDLHTQREQVGGAYLPEAFEQLNNPQALEMTRDCIKSFQNFEMTRCVNCRRAWVDSSTCVPPPQLVRGAPRRTAA